MDHSANLAVNEVTVLLVISGTVVTGLIAAFILVAASSILRGNRDNPDRLR